MNATRMMAVNRIRNEGEGRMGYEENRRGRRRMEYAGDGDYRYEGSRYGDGRYEEGRYEGAAENHDDTYDVKIRRERRGHEDMWPEDRERRMDTYPQQRRMEYRGEMPRIGFDGGREREMISFPHRGHDRMANQRFDRQTAEEWVEGMKNADESKGPRWTMEQTEQLRKQKGIEEDPVEFWAAMNASYSDLSRMAQKHGINTMEFWVDYVMAFWFCDEDAGKHKVRKYYETFGQK